MEKVDLDTLKTLINEYGAREALTAFIQILEECADEYSDQGLKERAHETVEVIELLSGTPDVTEA
jgi:hypothetical protein